MIRNLFIVAGSAFLLCLISFAGVAAFGGFDLDDHAWTVTEDEDGLTIRRGEDEAVPAAVRDLAWSGGERLEIAVPGEVVFTQSTQAGVRLEGPQAVIDRVSITDGRLTIAERVESGASSRTAAGPVDQGVGDALYASAEGLRVFISAPNVRDFRIDGATEVEIRDYDHADLTLTTTGSRDVRVIGRANTVSATVAGSGDVDLSDLDTTDARLVVSGSGSVRAGPTGSVEATLTGSGDIDLTRRPARLTQTVTGSGDVNQD